MRVQIAQVESSLRVELAQMGAGIRQEMAQRGAGIRQEIASGRVDLFKWCFLFWVGQVLAMAGMMGVMVRLFRP